MGKLPFMTLRRLLLAARSIKCQKVQYLSLRHLSGALVRVAESIRSGIAQQAVALIVNTIVELCFRMANIQMQKTGAHACSILKPLPASDLDRYMNSG